MTESNLLPVERRTLPNGAMLYHMPTPGAPLAILQAVIKTGSIHEGEDAGCGVSHFLEHMLFQGTSRYPDGAIGARVHVLGGDCNAYTSFDHTAYYIELPAEKISDAVDILTSMVAEPLFPEEKFRSEKTVIAREADMIFDRPEQTLMQNLWQQVFAVHPARLPIVGFPDKIKDVDHDRMVNYYRRRYGAARCYFLAAGAFDTDKLQAMLAEKLSGFVRGNLDEPVIPQVLPQQFERRTQTVFADPMARLALGVRTPAASDKIVPALDMLTGILGQNDSSRLVRQLWQERELAVNLSSSGFAASFGGVIGVTAACEPAKLPALEQGIREILADVRENGVTAQELEREKLQQRVHFYRSLENAREKINVVNDGLLNFGIPDFAERYLARLDALTLEEVNAAAYEYLNPNRFSWSILTPEKAQTTTTRSPKTDAKKIASGKLRCGAGYAVIRRSVVPMDELSVLLPAGPVWETGRPASISAMLSEVLTTGAGKWQENEFYTLLDDHGMELDISGGRNTLSIVLNFPAAERKLAETVLAELLLCPRWDESVFAREKSNLAEQLASRMMKPLSAALLAARKALYGTHAAGRDQLGTPEDLEKITLSDVQNYYVSRFDAAWVKFGGTAENLTADKKVKEYFEKLAARLPWVAEPLKEAGKVPAQTAPTGVIRIDLPREQSAVMAAIRSCTASAPEHIAVDVLDQALNDMASHLFDEVREKRSLAYTTGASLNYGLVPGVIALFAGVAPERAEEALHCLEAEIKRIRSSGLGKAEFEAARLGAISASARRLEESSTRLLSVLLSLFYHEPPESGLNAPERLAKLHYAECNKMLKKIFSASIPVTVIAGTKTRTKKSRKKA